MPRRAKEARARMALHVERIAPRANANRGEAYLAACRSQAAPKRAESTWKQSLGMSPQGFSRPQSVDLSGRQRTDEEIQEDGLVFEAKNRNENSALFSVGYQCWQLPTVIRR